MRRIAQLLVVLVMAAGLTLASGVAPASAVTCDKTWVGGSDLWYREDLPPTGQAQWSGGTLPNGSQGVCFPAGDYTVTMNIQADMQGLAVGDSSGGAQPTIHLTGTDATFGASLRVQDVDSVNYGTIRLGSSAFANTAFVQQEDGTSITNHGTIELIEGAGGPRVLDRGTWVNEGTIRSSSDEGYWGCMTIETSGVIDVDPNATLKWGNCGQTKLLVDDGSVINDGTFEVNAQLHVGGDAQVTGANPLRATGGVAITFDGDPSGSIQTMATNGVTGTIPDDITILVDNPNIAGGSNLQTSGNVTNNGTIRLTDVNGDTSQLQVANSTTLTNNGTIALEEGVGGPRVLTGGDFLNHGTIHSSSPTGRWGCTHITSDGTIDIDTDAELAWANCGQTRLTLDGGTVTNDGFIEANTAVHLAGTTVATGNPILARGGNLTFAGNPTGTIQAIQTVGVTGTIPLNVTLLVDNPDISGGSNLTTSGNVTNNGTIRLDDVNGDHSQLQVENATTLTNNGTIELEEGVGGARVLAGGGTYVNEGTIEVRSPSGFGACTTIVNRETFVIDAGAKLGNNCGGVHVDLEAGVATIDGELEVSTVDLDGGILRGTGTVDAPLVNDGGVIQPGNSTGVLTVDDSYTQDGDGVLEIEIDGTATPGTDFDRLAVTGPANLGGTLDVDANVIPSPAVSFLTASSITGDWDEIVNVPDNWVNVGATSATVLATQTFPDVPFSNPFFLDIEWMAAEGITTGYPNGTYGPNITLNRAAMSAFLYRVSGSPAYTPPTTPTFSDVPKSNPFYKEIEWMNAEGITTGYPNGTYRPNDALTRGAMSAFLYRVAGSPAYTPPTTPTFSDVPKSNPFYKEIEWMNAEGITTGYPNGTYKPNLTLDRAAMSAFLHRLVDLGFAPG